MRTTKYTNRFKRDYKREKAGRHGKKLDADLLAIVNLLTTDTSLPRRNFDHPYRVSGPTTGIATSSPTWC